MSSAGHGTGRAARILAGRYRLDEVIGRGGMSTVYRGTDLALDRVVAVKVALDPLAEENPVYVARFKREARAAAALNNPRVVTIYDAGADGPTRFIVMEYVDGRSLADVLKTDGPLEPARAARIAEEIADTLVAAHAAGIIHRDIKPGNVMLTAGDRVKVLDFGIARTADAVTLTQTASVLGTAPYMAPEQAMGQPADERSDIYSLGCVLYEMLTGRPPFMAAAPAAVLHQHVRIPVKPPIDLVSAIPPALDQLVVQMLAKKPEDRPQTAAEVRDRLRAFDSQTAATALVPPTPPEPTAPTKPLAPGIEALAGVAAAAANVPQVATASQAGTVQPEATASTRVLPTPAKTPSHRAIWAGLAAVAVLLLGAAIAVALTAGGSNSSTSSAVQSHPAAPAPASSPIAPPTTTHHTSSTQTSSSTPTTSSTSSSTTTTSTSSTATTTSGPNSGGAPPGQGGTPPGQSKKGKGG